MPAILIVEDYQPNRLALAAVLGRAGYRTVEAGDGREALVKIRAERFDLAICDILMPGMGGYEFARELRGDPALAHTPVVFWTATFDKPEARALAQACGVRHLLPKPADPAQILRVVTAALAEPPAGVTPEPEFDHAYVRLLAEKLDRALKSLEVRSGGRPARPILLVEDNPMDVDFLLQAFDEHSVANPVRVCRDGEEALEFMQAHATGDDPELPVLMLLDLRLPKVDGIDVLRQARGHPVWKRVPVVVLTTSRENDDIARAYELGVNSYLVKPVDFGSFSEVVKTIKVYWLLANEPPFPDPAGR